MRRPALVVLLLASATAQACASASQAADPCAPWDEALAAFQGAFAAAVACDPNASTDPCGNQGVTDRCGCVVRANVDAGVRSAAIAAWNRLQAANAEAAAHGCARVGVVCPASCAGGVQAARCVANVDGGGGVCQ